MGRNYTSVQRIYLFGILHNYLHKGRLFPGMRRNGLQFMLIPNADVIWQFLFPKRSHSYCVTSVKTNENLMDRDIGKETKSVLLRRFERDGVQDFSDEVWLQKIFEGF